MICTGFVSSVGKRWRSTLLIFGVLIVASQSLSQPKLKTNALASTLDGNLVLFLDYFKTNVRDTLFTLYEGKSATFTVTDSVVMRWKVIDVWSEIHRSYFVTDTSDTVNIEVRYVAFERMFVDSSKYNRTTIDTLKYYPALKQGDGVYTALEEDSLAVHQNVYSIALKSARFRMFLTWHPLMPDSIVIIRR